MSSHRFNQACFPLLVLMLGILCFSSRVTIAAEEEDSTPQYELEEAGILIPEASAAEPLAKEFSLKRAVKYLDGGAWAWTENNSCISCHTNGSYMQMRPSLSELLGKPEQKFRDFYVSELDDYKKMEDKALRTVGANAATVVYMAAGLAEWDAHQTKKLSPETDRALRFMFSITLENGVWNSVDCWPPFESSPYQVATVAAMAAATAPGWLESVKDDAEMQAAIGKLTTYLKETAPPHDYGKVLMLWTSLRYDGLINKQKQQELIDVLFSHQNEDGGWSIRSFAQPESWGKGNRAERLQAESKEQRTASDGHQTGLALLVLHEAGIKAEDPRIQKGLKWLLENQRESGRWWTRSLNTDEWHYVTFSGTIYPVTALIKYGAVTPQELTARTP